MNLKFNKDFIIIQARCNNSSIETIVKKRAIDFLSYENHYVNRFNISQN